MSEDLNLFPTYKLLIKFPSRNRHDILLKRLREYIEYADNINLLLIVNNKSLFLERPCKIFTIK